MTEPKYPPTTLSEVVRAIDGYRFQLAEHQARTDANLLHLRNLVEARIDIERAFKVLPR